MLLVGVIVAVDGVAFAGGRHSAPPADAAGSNNETRGTGGSGGIQNGTIPGATDGGQFGAGDDIGAPSGTVTAIAADHIVLRVGGSTGRRLDVAMDTGAAFHRESTAAAGDVKVGPNVLVRLGRSAGAGPIAPGASPGFGDALAMGAAMDVTILAAP